MTDLSSPPRNRAPVLLGLTLAAVIVLIAATLLVVWKRGPADDQNASPSSAATGTVTPTVPVTTEGETTLTLVPGTKTVSGVSIGYPHSLAGAVSAAVEYWGQVGSTLDPDRAATIGRVVADPSWTSAAQDFATGASNSRRRLGLPASGDTGAEAAIHVDPVAYQLRRQTSDSVTVLLLAYLTTVSPTDGNKSQVGVFPADMHWSGDDWKMRRGDDTDYSNLSAKPRSAAAQANGWMEFTP